MQKIFDHRNQPTSAIYEAMSYAGKYRKPGEWETGEIACHAATDQREKLHYACLNDGVRICKSERHSQEYFIPVFKFEK